MAKKRKQKKENNLVPLVGINAATGQYCIDRTGHFWISNEELETMKRKKQNVLYYDSDGNIKNTKEG